MIDVARMINNIVIHDASQERWLHFHAPKHIISAHRVEEIIPALNVIEEMVQQHSLYAAGFIAYEAAPAFDAALAVKQDSSFPLVWFGLYSRPDQLSLPIALGTHTASLSWSPSLAPSAYQDAIDRIKNYIEAGDTYQVNFTVRLKSPFRIDPWPYFIALAHAQDASYGAFVNTEAWCICSASPELLFRLDGTELISRPMKGTASRGLMLSDDQEQAAWLYSSEKNRAENVMIVDMVRNDMGRIAEVGSVHVSNLYEVEKYPTLWQMTSTVRAKTNAGLCKILQALFPAASITGAPKRRTMQIIAELEQTPRRIYTGSIGFISPDSKAQFNVAIRTVLVDKVQGQAEYGVGGGIVWDSIHQMEFEECRTKARILTHGMPDFALLETILWTPEEGYFLLPYHLTRLRDSAAYFSFPVDMGTVGDRLDALTHTLPPIAHKVRLLVAKDCGITSDAEPLGGAPIAPQPHVCLALAPIDSGNPFLYHKTTNRVVYEQALAGCPGYADVILWNEKGEVTESCIANIVVELDGVLYTPPIRCGLLPGTYRAYLLEQGKVMERVIKKEDLAQSPHVYLVNSVRREREVVVNGARVREEAV
jgi:para-aminobenzoate synthetase/4-amino-4-deoxychorismate lyase